MRTAPDSVLADVIVDPHLRVTIDTHAPLIRAGIERAERHEPQSRRTDTHRYRTPPISHGRNGIEWLSPLLIEPRQLPDTWNHIWEGERMRRDQDYYNRLIVCEGTPVRVRLRPRGSEFRDLTNGFDVVNWFTILPGLISILGWILHHTLFRSRWIVSVVPGIPDDNGPRLRLDPLPKREAESTFLSLLDWIDEGHPLKAFRVSRKLRDDPRGSKRDHA